MDPLQKAISREDSDRKTVVYRVGATVTHEDGTVEDKMTLEAYQNRRRAVLEAERYAEQLSGYANTSRKIENIYVH